MRKIPAQYTAKNGKRANGQQKFKPDSKRFLFNVDTLWYTVECTNYDEIIEQFAEILEIGKQHAIEHNDISKYHEIMFNVPLFENPIVFLIQPNGLKPNWSWQIRNEDMAIYLSRRDRKDGKNFPIRVQINQFYLWTRGARQAVKDVNLLLKHMGFITTKYKPSRIDLCCHSDQYDWRIHDFKSSVFTYPNNIRGDVLPNFHKLNVDTGEFETMYIGDRSRLQLRIYNKSKEIIKKNKDYFIDIYEQNGLEPFKVWNIEFEIRRHYLKKFVHPVTNEIGCYDDLEYLLSEEGLSYLWTNVSRDKFTHKSEFWKVLQEGDINKFTLLDIPTIRSKEIDISVEREVAQIYGRLQTLILNDVNSKDEEIDDGYELFYALEKLKRLFREYENKKEKNFADEVLKKRSRYMDYLLNKLSRK